MTINWGWGGNLDEDLKAAGYKFKSQEAGEVWKKLKFARTILTVKGMLTEAESDRVVKRFQKAIAKDIEQIQEAQDETDE